MAKSLFERYYTIHEKRAVMLDIQYRMVRTLTLHDRSVYNSDV